MSPTVAALVAALALAGVHAGAASLTFLDQVPRSRWLSFGSGVSVAYVFVHLLPELAEIERELEGLDGGALAFLEKHAWVFALVGLATIYGLQLALRRRGATSEDEVRHDGVGWLHLATYTLYNGVIGYLLRERAADAADTLLLFTLAMAMHFLVNDRGLAEDHGALYHRIGRWVVASGTLVGWAVSVVSEVSEQALGLLVAFLAGGIILNTLKEELPERRQSRFTPFAFGAAGYAAVLLAL